MKREGGGGGGCGHVVGCHVISVAGIRAVVLVLVETGPRSEQYEGQGLDMEKNALLYKLIYTIACSAVHRKLLFIMVCLCRL